MYPPGSYYSPLLDIKSLCENDLKIKFDGIEFWECVNMSTSSQRAYYEMLLKEFPILQFPQNKTPNFRYYTENIWFPASDAFTLSGIIRKEGPRRIIEVGSGFSSAVMLDTLQDLPTATELTFIEPNPDRLYSLLTQRDSEKTNILVQEVQTVPPSVFEQLTENDILFIDSSHIAKIGSDLAFILLRILPRLRRGVLIHFHDIFYPESYPIHWIREGRAWNESIFIRAMLCNNPGFEVVAFNPYAAYSWPDLFRQRFPMFLKNSGGSIWLRKTTSPNR